MSEYGHRKMIVWRNIEEVERMVFHQIMKCIPKNQFNILSQIDRASDSVGANFIEGYYSGSIKEYIRFLKYSKRSMAELQGWIQRCHNKGLISKEMFEVFDDLAMRTLYLLNRLINALFLKSQSKS